jgi:hypothetical protein
MTIEQTVEIQADHRLVLELPHNFPLGRAQVAITTNPPVEYEKHESEILRQIEELKRNELPRPHTIEEAIKQAEAIAADPNRKPISRLFGTHKGIFGGDGVAYQRKIRDEWD